MAGTIPHEDAHEQNLMPEVNTTDLVLGGNLDLTTGGAYLEATSRVDGMGSLTPRTPFNDLNAADKCVIPYAGLLLIGDTIQPDDGFDFVGATKTVYFPERTEGALVQKYYVKGGTVNATSVVNFKVYRGTSAGDIIPANLRYEADLPASLWQGNGVEFSFGINEYGVAPYTNLKHLDFLTGESSIVVYTSSNNFSVKFNVSQTLPYLRADQHIITEREALDQFTTRSPYIVVEVDTSGGDVPMPLLLGRNYMKNLSEIRSSFFNFVKDGTNGDYYEYTGEDGALNMAITSAGYLSNEPGAELTPGIDIELFGGGNTIQYGPRREFDGVNEGNLSFPTDGILQKGDKVRLFIDADQAVELGQLTFFRKNVFKVS